MNELGKSKTPTKQEILSARNKTLHDIIMPGLRVLFCGINPGLYSAAVGHHFARPGNRFWATLYKAGFTDRILAPSEETVLLSLGYGLTDIVNRATLSADELTKEELEIGGKEIINKIHKFRPRYLAVLGIGAYKIAFNKRSVHAGLQEDKIGSTKIWILPSPSGLNAHYSKERLIKFYKELHDVL